MFSPSDTIVAVATPAGRGGIGVVRISGPRAQEVGRALLETPAPLVARHATLTRVRDESGARLDEVLATFFPAPHSYTSEDVVEISTHGSPALLRAVLRSAIRAGARLAEPGEFTLRAFLNGRIDLVQAEAVADLVEAATPLQARVAFDQLEGTLTQAIGRVDGELFDVCVRLEASLDFPEEGYHFVGRDEVREALAAVRDRLGALLDGAHEGRLIREGRHLAVLGRPNVGKSSLFNWFVGSDRAIVSDTPGTTRDLVTEHIDFEGIRLGLVDTAGIRPGEDSVEREGVARARRAASVAEAVLVVCDASQPCEQDDRDVLDQVPESRRLVVLNKIDLGVHGDWVGFVRSPGAFVRSPGALAPGSSPGPEGPGLRPEGLSPGPEGPGLRPEGASPFVRSPGALAPGEGPSVFVSLKTGEGLDKLRVALRTLLGHEAGGVPRDEVLVTNVRHETLLRHAHEAMVRSVAALDDRGGDVSEELVLADVADARHALEEVTGRRSTEDLLRRIFERFCIGK
ncbi:MAG: tRNA uridine-5-carboxymethylaminomethyl(34) synthesis GTPase MnmE [Vicinamibacterales bacterium]|nr:tRNA uridine-5-carboxymethylaminomethyl(34) synthesis GTPase MnmE [Vicinamibacterales bacterium]